jgi:hexosaminidase
MPRGLAGLALALALASTAGFADAQQIAVTPRPQTVEIRAGAPVALGPATPLVFSRRDPGAASAARYLARLVARSRGYTLGGDRTSRRGTTVVFVRERSAGFGPEGYALDVGPRGARITAETDAGLFYGAVTLWQLMTADASRGPVSLSPVHIVDRPRFAWRGLLLDSARHYQSPAFIERLIDVMAEHKLNVLQWHLTDDQGWRLEIRRYPRLTGVGAWRPGIDRATGKPIRYGGFYSQAEVRRIVAYAARRHVTIVPEIEMPGHSLAAIVAYPELGSGPPDPKTLGDWGIFPDILAPNDRTYAFMIGVLTEVTALFPSQFIAIGGDEAVKDQWRGSPAVQAQIKRLGLANEDALQGWFTARIGGFLAAHHRRMIGWDDILVGGDKLPADAATLSWHADGAIRATSAGHDTVIATDPLFYLDHRQAASPGEPPGRGAVVSLADVYGVEPVSAAMTSDEANHIIGVQANLWTEHMPTEADVAKMALPRAAALAEVAWTAPARKDGSDFAARLPAELRRDREAGLEPDVPRPTPPEPAEGSVRRVSQQLTSCTGKILLNLAGVDDAQGSQPYLVDAMNACWLWPGADLARFRRLRVSATRLPFNFQLGGDIAKVSRRPATTPDGELEVRVDGCAAAPVARIPLAPPARADGSVRLAADLPTLAGPHDLCLTFTQPRLDPMWMIGWAELVPAGAP